MQRENPIAELRDHWFLVPFPPSNIAKLEMSVGHFQVLDYFFPTLPNNSCKQLSWLVRWILARLGND